MKMIQIFSDSGAVGMRMRDILYEDGFADITVSAVSAMPEHPRDHILIIYANSNLAGLMQNLSGCGCRVILLLNPDCYAMYLDRARHCGFTLLLMPVAPFMLLDAVRSAIS